MNNTMHATRHDIPAEEREALVGLIKAVETHPLSIVLVAPPAFAS